MKQCISNHKTAALSQVEVLVILSALAILLVIFYLRNQRRDLRREARIITCISNLKQIGDAYRVWEGNHGDKFPMQTSVTNGGTMELVNGNNAWINFLVMSNELRLPKILICPADADKIASTNFTTDFNNSKISYFVGLDADETNPQMFLSGDDNFAIGDVPVKSGLLQLSTNTSICWTATRHHFSGEIVLSDGSVRTSLNKNEAYSLTNLIQQTGLATNHFAIP